MPQKLFCPNISTNGFSDLYQKTTRIDLWNSHYERMEENYRRLKEINKKLRREVRQRMGGDLNELNINELMESQEVIDAELSARVLQLINVTDSGFHSQDDGSDSLAVQLVDEKHWEDLFIVIAVSKECLEKVTQTRSFLAQPRESHLLLLTGKAFTSFPTEHNLQ
ncbi:hypothetical protein ES319_D06G090100v1 [Gossypium barbadense]|uniref:K-box domain-containing protein n=1 Tax=Gossypium barbadense TaxID=3634 RepID=A0A5J5QZP2_GOSBA|nr:hypothetical protein ES319_D06G090100v1 [Gossypium barbadense]